MPKKGSVRRRGKPGSPINKAPQVVAEGKRLILELARTNNTDYQELGGLLSALIAEIRTPQVDHLTKKAQHCFRVSNSLRKNNLVTNIRNFLKQYWSVV